MTDFQKPASSARFDWPVWTCGAVDGERGTVCGLVARWKELPVANAVEYWIRCDRHKGARAVPIAGDEPFCVTRVELRVAVATLGTDRRAAAIEGIRAVTNAIEVAGGVVTGLKVPGGRASEPTTLEGVGRLQLAGPHEGRQRGDQPFWGAQDAPEWVSNKRRRTG